MSSEQYRGSGGVTPSLHASVSEHYRTNASEYPGSVGETPSLHTFLRSKND